MTRDDVRNEYFKWLSDLVCGERYGNGISYDRLLMFLHDTEFRYLHPRDENRAEDGKFLRYRFGLLFEDTDYIQHCLNGPCSVLEMMVALALHIEEHIMDDPNVGDRTRQWFWGMVTNLGLGSMYGNRFDRRQADDIIERFLSRDYEPDGKGGLFTVRHCDRDLRDVEIYYQMCWYINSITL